MAGGVLFGCHSAARSIRTGEAARPRRYWRLPCWGGGGTGRGGNERGRQVTTVGRVTGDSRVGNSRIGNNSPAGRQQPNRQQQPRCRPAGSAGHRGGGPAIRGPFGGARQAVRSAQLRAGGAASAARGPCGAGVSPRGCASPQRHLLLPQGCSSLRLPRPIGKAVWISCVVLLLSALGPGRAAAVRRWGWRWPPRREAQNP